MNEVARDACASSLQDMRRAVGDSSFHDLKVLTQGTKPKWKLPAIHTRKDVLVTIATLIGMAVAAGLQYLLGN